VERSYLFTFASHARARLFVERLACNMGDLAICVEGAEVRVVDGSDQGQREAILALAKRCDATAAEIDA
jgi:hypothetical protein